MLSNHSSTYILFLRASLCNWRQSTTITSYANSCNSSYLTVTINYDLSITSIIHQASNRSTHRDPITQSQNHTVPSAQTRPMPSSSQTNKPRQQVQLCNSISTNLIHPVTTITSPRPQSPHKSQRRTSTQGWNLKFEWVGRVETLKC
ncbi:hypothetical protein M0R45_018791 [Rubus argutus]|uniref:Uncharacterized protein n=1 Tax=Rubus argutus TaxID=59490 RepID=A0AAW1X710_RUBAR